ncbi:hypothetical protein [uncultured Salegentibacter sp.]|uniref:hypothetical protein n=1 Tax=uncultured Salegentibacter sp. TaxID=259320 RepID=UPI0030DA3329
MKSYQSEIEKLFSSTGEFGVEWKKYLDSLELENQRDFLEQLHQNILTERSLRSIYEKEFGVGNKEIPLKFRYSALDYKAAQNSEPLHSERLLDDMSNDPDFKVKYRATRIFHERKAQEIKGEKTEVKRFLNRLKELDGQQRSFKLSDKTRHLFHGEEFPLIKLPPHFSKKNLTDLLRNNQLAKGFSSDEDYQLFKSNSFALLSTKNSMVPVNIEVGDRRYLAKKMQKIYEKFKEEKSDYPDLDLSRRAYAVALLANISDYQNSKTSENNLEAKLKVIMGEMR